MSRKQTLEIDYTNRDYEAYRTMLIQMLSKKIPEYTDTSQTDAGIVILECLANGLDICSMYADIIANDCFLPTTQDRQIAVLLARQLGYTPKGQTASVIPQVFVLNSILDRNITIPKGTIVSTKQSSDMETVYFETMRNLVIPMGSLGNELNEDGTYKYIVDVAQGSSVNEDLLGSSNGLPYQSFMLSYQEVLVDTIELQVNEGDGFKTWTQVENFISSDTDSQHYIVTVDEFDNCYIQFGSGAKGKIPNIYDNGIIASYRTGGGTIGNVKANTITELVDSIAYVQSTFNPYAPTTYGHEKETIDEIRENAPANFRTQDRAITAQDYADLVKINFYEILSAVGIPDPENKLNMNIYYFMRDDYTMTDGLLERLNTFFSTRVIPGTTYTFKAHEEYPVSITANLIVDNDYYRSEVVALVQDYIENTYFARGNFVFGDTIVKTDLEHEIHDTFRGVKSFRITIPDTDIIAPSKDNMIITFNNLVINATGGKI